MSSGAKLEMTDQDPLLQRPSAASSSPHDANSPHDHQHHHVDDHQPASPDEIDDLGEEAAAELHLDISKIVASEGMHICGLYLSTNALVAINGVFIVVFSLALALGLTPPKDNPAWKVVSAVIGWGYFTIWSLSFFPQIFLNWKRKSVIGQNADYLYLNLWGYFCYTIYNCCFFFNETVQDEYQERFGSQHATANATKDHHDVMVRPNDVAFAVFALTFTIVNVWQYIPALSGYEKGAQTVSKPVRWFIAITMCGSIIWAILISLIRTKYFFNPIDFLYGLGITKLAITIIKYVPQIMLSARRHSTIGWNRFNVWADFTGGLLSVCQELLDAGETHDWKGMIGNPVKFGLGFASVVYDIIMLVQHYCLYAERNEELIQEHERKVLEAADAAQ